MYIPKRELDDLSEMIIDSIGQESYNTLAETTKKLTILDAVNATETVDTSVVAYYIYKQCDAGLPLYEIRSIYVEYKPMLEAEGLMNENGITSKGLDLLRSQVNILNVMEV